METQERRESRIRLPFGLGYNTEASFTNLGKQEKPGGERAGSVPVTLSGGLCGSPWPGLGRSVSLGARGTVRAPSHPGERRVTGDAN